MVKVLVISDDGVATGYGRIAMEVNRRLHKRGYSVFALSLPYDGLLPPQLDGQPLPYWVGSLSGKDFNTALIGVVGAVQPDIIHVVQDAPYAMMVRNAPLDWSRYALVVTTPVDGEPLYTPWVNLFKQVDGMLTISEFGVQAHKRAGVHSVLCRPGVDGNVFYRYPADQRDELRGRLGLAPTDFLLMTAAQNQGRKAIPAMLEGFFEFCVDKPDARYLLDMDGLSPVGWDIRDICQQQGWDAGRLIFREDALRAGVTSLTDRFNCADAHAVLAFREGYGIPLVEAMACGVVSMAMDYCSGPEIVGGGKGVLVKASPLRSLSTWGGAWDRFPDVGDFAGALDRLYYRVDERRTIAESGMAWSRAQTWDQSADAVQGVYQRVLAARAQHVPANPAPGPALSDLIHDTPLIEADTQMRDSLRLKVWSAEHGLIPMTPELSQLKANLDALPPQQQRVEVALFNPDSMASPFGVDPLFPNATPGNLAGTGIKPRYSGLDPHFLIMLGLDPTFPYADDELNAALDRYRRESDAPTAPPQDEDPYSDDDEDLYSDDAEDFRYDERG